MIRAPSAAVLVDREIDALDQLAARLRGGVRSAAEFEALEEAAQGIAARLIAAFRSGRAG